jgi:uncharacterized HAD superfamily protein
LSYLKSNILGVDIDGVLNKHREHFCQILKEKTGKKIAPEKITIIPVHENKNINVSREDERNVFNDPKYWVDIKPVEDVPAIMRNLHNIFKVKIFLFTYRPWPDAELKKELAQYKTQFLDNCKKLPSLDIILKYLNKLKTNPLAQITKEWLKRHKFSYDKLIIERGNDYSSDSRINFKNRFYIAKKKRLKFFVEDDIEKATKLSFICDVVFLISHPYNTPHKNLPKEINKLRENIPRNIIRVNNWSEIYSLMRRLS